MYPPEDNPSRNNREKLKDKQASDINSGNANETIEKNWR